MPPSLQRVVLALLATAVPGAAAPAQDAAGAQLWRLAAGTLARPAALNLGAVAAFWNPAQPRGIRGAVAGLELIQTPGELGATGFLAAFHLPLGSFGTVGLAYGRMQVNDLVRTSTSPEPVPGTLPYHVAAGGASWARALGPLTAGAMLRVLDTRLDLAQSRRWTLDGGLRFERGRLHLAAATHFLSHARGDPAQDVFAGCAYRIWAGEAWPGSRLSALELRYGLSFGHAAAIEHAAGLGVVLGGTVGLDILVAREGAAAHAEWRPAGGVQLSVGRYVVTLAGDAGVNGMGTAFRVGLEAVLP